MPMTKLLEEVFGELQQLPAAEQDHIAAALRELLPDAGKEAEWNRLAADPRSERALELLVKKAELDITTGNVVDHDPGST